MGIGCEGGSESTAGIATRSVIPNPLPAFTTHIHGVRLSAHPSIHNIWRQGIPGVIN